LAQPQCPRNHSACSPSCRSPAIPSRQSSSRNASHKTNTCPWLNSRTRVVPPDLSNIEYMDVSEEEFGFPDEDRVLSEQCSDLVPEPTDAPNGPRAFDTPANSKQVSFYTHNQPLSASSPDLRELMDPKQAHATSQSTPSLSISARQHSEPPTSTQRSDIATFSTPVSTKLKARILQFFGFKSRKPKHIPVFPDDPEYSNVVCTRGVTVHRCV
jgi:hypothetical protein